MRDGVRKGMVRAAIAVLPLCAAVTLTACAASSYAGIPLQAGAADPEVQWLARRAQAGDKHAQLELGIRFEEGRGVRCDQRRAEILYAYSSGERGRTRWAYIPAVNGASGHAVPVKPGLRKPGLVEAQARLDHLRGRQAGLECPQ